MKSNSITIISALLLLFLFIPAMSFAQPDTDQPLEAYLNSPLIKEQNIRSLTVYADFNENGIDIHGGEGGKLAEIEFDTNGNQCYKITSRNSGNLPFISYGRGSIITIDAVDQQGRKLSAYVENYRYSEEVLKEYDAAGNVLSELIIYENDTLKKTGFVWSEGKMVQATILHSNESNKNTVNEFNPDGKLAKHISGDLRQEYFYEQSGDILTTTVSTYQFDSLMYTEAYSTNTSFDQITHYTRKQPSGALEIEMNVQFDASGNAISYFLHDRTEAYDGEIPPPLTVVIENSYNPEKLLIKRRYFYSVPGVADHILTRIDRYCYDTEPLTYKLEKGVLIQREEMQETYDR